MTFEGRNGGRVSPSFQFKVCCPECAMPKRCPHCGQSFKAQNHRFDGTVLVRVVGSFKCGTSVVYVKEGNKFSPEWREACK